MKKIFLLSIIMMLSGCVTLDQGNRNLRIATENQIKAQESEILELSQNPYPISYPEPSVSPARCHQGRILKMVVNDAGITLWMDLGGPAPVKVEYPNVYSTIIDWETSNVFCVDYFLGAKNAP